MNPNKKSANLHYNSVVTDALVQPTVPQLIVGSVDEVLEKWIHHLSQLRNTTTGGPKPQPSRSWLKYGMDCTIILLALPTLLVLFALCVALVMMNSPASIFKRRRALGLGGQPFDLLQFQTARSDGSLTKAGVWFNQTGLGQLPQILNVLMGQMSLVGPCAISAEELDSYGEFGEELLSVLPGVTGAWQIEDGSPYVQQNRILLDIQYVRQRTLAMDLRIIFIETPLSILRRNFSS